MFNVTGSRRGCCGLMGGVGGNEGPGEELGAKEGKVVVDGDDLGLCVKMVNAGHLHAACCGTEGGVLEGLEFADGGGGGVGEPDGSCISIKGPDEGLQCDYDGLLMLPTGCASQGTEKV